MISRFRSATSLASELSVDTSAGSCVSRPRCSRRNWSYVSRSAATSVPLSATRLARAALDSGPLLRSRQAFQKDAKSAPTPLSDGSLMITSVCSNARASASNPLCDWITVRICASMNSSRSRRTVPASTPSPVLSFRRSRVIVLPATATTAVIPTSCREKPAVFALAMLCDATSTASCCARSAVTAISRPTESPIACPLLPYAPWSSAQGVTAALTRPCSE